MGASSLPTNRRPFKSAWKSTANYIVYANSPERRICSLKRAPNTISKQLHTHTHTQTRRIIISLFFANFSSVFFFCSKCGFDQYWNGATLLSPIDNNNNNNGHCLRFSHTWNGTNWDARSCLGIFSSDFFFGLWVKYGWLVFRLSMVRSDGLISRTADWFLVWHTTYLLTFGCYGRRAFVGF